jgi:translation initiation factor IF-1
MSNGDLVEMEGNVMEAMGGGQYLIQIDNNTIRARLAGKMKQNKIRVLPGDKVRVAVSPYDMSHGIIIRRHK